MENRKTMFSCQILHHKKGYDGVANDNLKISNIIYCYLAAYETMKTINGQITETRNSILMCVIAFWCAHCTKVKCSISDIRNYFQFIRERVKNILKTLHRMLFSGIIVIKEFCFGWHAIISLFFKLELQNHRDVKIVHSNCVTHSIEIGTMSHSEW